MDGAIAFVGFRLKAPSCCQFYYSVLYVHGKIFRFKGLNLVYSRVPNLTEFVRRYILVLFEDDPLRCDDGGCLGLCSLVSTLLFIHILTNLLID